jgi:hypothetical protein
MFKLYFLTSVADVVASVTLCFVTDEDFHRRMYFI